MYVPLLHARQEERLAVRAIARNLVDAGNVSPFYIPVRDQQSKPGVARRQLELAVREVSRARLRTYVLTTPIAHRTDPAQSTILRVMQDCDDNSVTIPVVAVTNGKPLATLTQEIAALNGRPFGVLHRHEAADPDRLQTELDRHEVLTHFFYEDDCDGAYRDRWEFSNRVLLHDGFNRQQRNADHEEDVNEEYSDLAYRYRGESFEGYGDHTIVGEVFTPTGGGNAAITVAIHLTFPMAANQRQSIGIRHFLSDDTTAAAPRGVCVGQAIAKLVQFVNQHQRTFAFSSACQYFTARPAPTPSLGMLKRKSIQHHLELMAHLNL